MEISRLVMAFWASQLSHLAGAIVEDQHNAEEEADKRHESSPPDFLVVRYELVDHVRRLPPFFILFWFLVPWFKFQKCDRLVRSNPKKNFKSFR